MAFIIKDRVKEGTVTTGTGAFALGGAASTFEAFNTYMSNGDTAYYAVVHTASGVNEWEIGLGTFNTGNTLTRTTILSSSNSGNAVSFSSGTKDIFMTYPADRAVIEEPNRSVSFPAGISVTGNVAASGTIDGRDVAADGTKLDGIETAATADQTAAEIRTLVESATDSNVFTDADHTKLNAIEAGATVDQTASEIRALVESATDSNVFTDADHTKLNAIEAGATADQTKSDIEGLGIDVPAANLTGTIAAARLSTAATQAESDDSTKIATTAYVTDKIETLIGGAPGTLNDLNELAAAINDDANYNSTLTTALGTKLPKSGGTMTGAIDMGSNNITTTGKMLFANMYATEGDLPSASTYHGMFAHVHATGAGYFAHGGSWVKLANDSQISDENFTTADHSKLDDIEANADVTDTANVTSAGALMDSEVTNLAQVKAFDSSDYATAAQGTIADNALPKSGGAMTGAITTNSTFDGRDVATDGAKLDGIESNAKNDQTITAGSGLSGGGTGNVTLSHADTSSVSNSDNSGNTFIQDITFDTYGHVQSVGTGTVSVGNGTLTVQGIGALGGSGIFTANQSGNATISISHDDTSSQASSNNSGRTYIQDVTLDTYGHVTGLSTATETVVDTNTNQLTTFQLEDGDGTEVTVSHGKEVKFTEGQGINVNWTDTSTGSDGDPYDMEFALKANGVRANELNVSGNGSSSQFLRSDGDGSFTWATPTDTNTTYSVGDGGLTQKNFTSTLKTKLDGIASGAQVNVPTNLGSGTSATDVTIVSSSGSNTTVPGATTSAAGVISAADKTKLNGIATGATANVGDITGVTAGTNLNGGGSSGGVTLNLDSTITVTTVNAGTVNTTSDERAKDDITPITGALDKVQQLGGYSFTLKATEEKSSGVIAQEVQKVMPELVQEDTEGLLSVQYGNMVGLLIEAIKEQQTQIDELKEKLNS